MYKLSIYTLVVLMLGSFAARANNAPSAATTSCGINISVALARLSNLTISKTDDNQLQSTYPSATVSMLDVKQMCQKLGVSVTGVKSTFDELLSTATPSIINLNNPGHFLVLLDGNTKTVRIIDGDNGSLEVVPRSDIESRYTGFALITNTAKSPDAPAIQMPQYDEYQAFEGLNQQAKFDFPLQNAGKSPLSVEILGTSCGCTAAVVKESDPKKLLLAPGKSSDILVNYEVHGEGMQQQSVTLKTNDPRHPIVYLTIRGELPPQLALSPPAFYVQQPKGDSPHKVLKVIGPKGTAVKKIW